MGGAMVWPSAYGEGHNKKTFFTMQPMTSMQTTENESHTSAQGSTKSKLCWELTKSGYNLLSPKNVKKPYICIF